MSGQTDSKIDYVEFPATDIPATKAFYNSLFGWEFIDYGDEYVALTRESAGIDGGFTTQSPVGSGVLIVLYADDLEATKAKVESAGGAIVKDIFSFPGGRRFHFSDPNGNELAIWTLAAEEA